MMAATSLLFSDDDEAFRDEVRTWLRENVPSGPRPPHGAEMRAFDLAWQRTQFDAGWAGIAWPQEHGGRGLGLVRQLIWFEEYGQLDLPVIESTFVGNRHAGPTLIARATDEQQAAHLPPILRGDVIWCQGFSEPEAGSDLAGLRTRAEIDGDHLVVTGQKVWTSFADIADWQELLVRTDPDAPKHKGITWVICDMHAPGIEVRPIETMDGGQEFAEVFYDEVRIPVANVVGEINDGWSVAMSTLAFERGTAFTVHQVKLASIVDQLIAEVPDDARLLHELRELRAEATALRSLTYLNVARNLTTDVPGPEGSMLKLGYADLVQRVARVAIEIAGDDALRRLPASWTNFYLTSFAASIEGGTSEIQRNIIGERVLGLPR